MKIKLIIFFFFLQIHVSFPTEQGNTYSLDLKLAHEINPSQCTSKVLPSKIEIKLKKKEGFQWTKLEEDPSLRKTVKHIPTGNVFCK